MGDITSPAPVIYSRITSYNVCYTKLLRHPPCGGGWIRTTEAYASDLQSDPFGHSGTPPKRGARFCLRGYPMSNLFWAKTAFCLCFGAIGRRQA